MNRFSTLRVFGLFALVCGLALFLLVFVFPYSRLLGKEQLDFGNDAEALPGEDRRLPVLPIYSRLKDGRGETEGEIFLTIERLGIRHAPVTKNVYVDNLKPSYLNSLLNSLAHLDGTALPGQRGNSVIFGHSAIPYLYNPRSFQTIFTKIDELQFGDVISVETKGQTFKYKVEKGGLINKLTTVSDFASVKSRLTLLTCYPPGFKSEKYAVRAIITD